ncbi:glucose PTS transporter subunit IIA [Lacticaseibacillus hulanensis]|uniref:glucose PTS transporter subunit IIA n=1 Tax=Lacticaseibacillus hulanensis TaxID=2493111 RepID=UPI000FD8FECD|nr:glucose PTS transporter subunit IIA [Lacticaseibacillus hulanensis]
MAEDKYSVMGQAIFDHVGGPGNVEKLIHCMTRVRMTIRDYDKVDMEGLKKIPGVLGVVEEDTLQVVIGPGAVNKVALAMVNSVGVELGETFPSESTHASNKEAVNAKAAEVHAAQKAKLKQTWWRQVLQAISGIFIPLIPVFVGAGLVSGIAAILSNLMVAGTIGKNWTDIITVLKVINGGLFSYLAIYVGINSATQFKSTPGIGGAIGAMTLLPGVVAPVTITNIFNGQPLAAGQGGIIGVIFAVWIASMVERKLHKWIPDSVDIIFTPMLTLLVVGAFTIFLVMPIAGVVSSSLVGAIQWVLSVGGAFSGFVLGLFFLPMVMFGLHQILTPIHVEMIAKLGYTPLLPILAMAGAGQVGAAIALWIRARKNKKLTGLIKGALPVGILGVGEPLIYGVTLPLGRPFITACIGGGIGGAVIGGLGNIGAIAIGPSGVALIPLIANGKWLGYVFGLLAAYAGGFVATYFFGVPKSAMVDEDEEVAVAADAPVATVSAPEPAAAKVAGKGELVATATGDLLPMDQVNDDVFSKKMVGDGFAINPSMGTVVAPADGTIVSVADTKHAIMMTTANGMELLLHLGLDTVELGGKPFTVNVKAGDTVHAGQQIALMDLDAIKQAGKQTTVITAVTNMDAVDSITPITAGKIDEGTLVQTVVTK